MSSDLRRWRVEMHRTSAGHGEEGEPEGSGSMNAWCERATEALIYFLVVLTPWAFGTTQEWSMRAANIAGYLLGALLLTKWLLRWRAARGKSGWDTVERASTGSSGWLTGWMAALNIALLVYVWVSALNARATYDRYSCGFAYHNCISWLPHSYDSSGTWAALWDYVAWTAVFWAIRDWLRGQPEAHGPFLETHSPNPHHPNSLTHPRSSLPTRVRTLLWVLSINGGVLALEGLIQQTTGTNKLLWFQETVRNRAAESQFGPYAYRANGAQYLNLVWPVTLGFWWLLQRGRSARWNTHHLLLACVLIMIVGPIASLSRGGAFVSVGMALLCGLIFLMSRSPGHNALQKLALVLFLASAVLGGVNVGWEKLWKRVHDLSGGIGPREEMYRIAGQMAMDYPLLGTGPKTFAPLYQLYRPAQSDYWPAQLHNDWLETRITFGWVGFSMILGLLGAVLAHWFVAPGPIVASGRFVCFFWVAMAGCLVHARWDFPFQVYSIVLLFLVWCAVLLCVGRRGVMGGGSGMISVD
jgi:O-antigen ligase